jgi:hypothetical protein
MKNLLVSVSSSLLAFIALGLLSNKQPTINQVDIQPIYGPQLKISSNKLLDSIENFKISKHNQYESQIKKSFENVKNQEKKQEELNMSIDSISCMVDTSSSINK